MRRRQAYAVPSESGYEQIKTEQIINSHVPGVCRKCGEHIGRGVRWHEKACNGNIRRSEVRNSD